LCPRLDLRVEAKGNAAALPVGNNPISPHLFPGENFTLRSAARRLLSLPMLVILNAVVLALMLVAITVLKFARRALSWIW
jgi:hypothetical protein